MGRLLLLRHAKSAWSEAGLPDRDRPLAPRGRRAAALIAAEIARLSLPDRILCSPATRTRETLAALLPYLPSDQRVSFVDDLYEPPSGDYRAAITAHGGDAATLLVVGHNPATQATALLLIGARQSSRQPDIAEKFPTCALAIIGFDAAAWADVKPQTGELLTFLRPRDLDPSQSDD